MRSKLRTALSFSLHDWWLLLQAWGLLLAVDLALRTRSFRSVQRKLSLDRDESVEIASAEKDKIIRVTRDMVELAARYHFYSMTCLRRSLVLQCMLAIQGIRTDLRFGAQYDHGALVAHAWLEYRGQPVGEPEHITECYPTLMAFAESFNSLKQPENSMDVSG